MPGWLAQQPEGWVRRGGELRTARVRHLMLDPSVRVVLFWDGPGDDRPTEVGAADREALWNRIGRFLKDGDPKAEFPVAFRVEEYRTATRESLLIVRESC